MPVLGAGGGGGNPTSIIQELVFASSTTWVCPKDCKAFVSAIGGGGGGACMSYYYYNYKLAAGGGGAGGHARSFLDLTASTTYTITVGAGGGSGDQYAQNSAKVNQHGGASSFAGSGITTLTGNGGSGGAGSYSNSSSANSAAGGAGGAASGGNLFNATGGAGGTATCNHSYSGGNYSFSSAGGGAVGVFGATGGAGGNATTSYGGHGAGGSGGSPLYAGVSSAGNGTDYGMDAYGSTFTENGHPQGAHTVGLGAGQAYYGGSSVVSTDWAQAPSDMNNSGDSIFHSLYGSNTGYGGGPGCPGMFIHGDDTEGKICGSNAGRFAGAGGRTNVPNQYSSYGVMDHQWNLARNPRHAQGGFGGGGGGGVTQQGGTPRAYMGNGGVGLVVVTIVEMAA